MKRDTMDIVDTYIMASRFRNVKFTSPVKIEYTFYEPNRRRDKDNIAAFAVKCIQDSLVEMGIIKNDGWAYIDNYFCDFDVDAINPRIEIKIYDGK